MVREKVRLALMRNNKSSFLQLNKYDESTNRRVATFPYNSKLFIDLPNLSRESLD